MKKISLLTSAVVVISMLPSAYGIQTNCYQTQVYLGDGKPTEAQVILEHEESGDVTAHFEITPGWSQPIVTVSPSNRVEIELQIKAHSPQANAILNNIVTNQKDLIACLRNNPKTTQDVDACVDLLCATWLEQRKQILPQYPAGLISPEKYKAFVNAQWNGFVELANDFALSAKKETHDIASFTLSGTVNTQEVENIVTFREKREALGMSESLLHRAYIEPIQLLQVTLAKKDLEKSHASCRVTKVEITNQDPIASFKYEKPKMQ